MKPKYIIILGLLFYFFENCYFGWNEKPSCNAEKIADFISAIIILTGTTRYFILQIAEGVINKLKKEIEK